jgi:hypothetical protein
MFHSSSATAAAIVPDGRNFGFAMYGDTIGQPSNVVAADFDRVKAAGGTWVRVPFNWTTLEMNGKGVYNWGPADMVVNLANARGLKVDAVVSYTPAWARPAGTTSLTPPTNSKDYGDFMAAATKHYAPMGVHTWEIWNEPNLHTMWAPNPNVAKYTSLLKAAYPVIHAADPGATVLTGGTSPAYDATDGSQVLPNTWLKGIYANGGKGYFDAVAHHPATYPTSSTVIASWSAFQQSNDLYATMVANGDGSKKIWATEIVFPTGTNAKAVSEVVQGQRYAESFNAWTAFSFHGPMFIFSLRDSGTDPTDLYSNMGIYHLDGTPKASVIRVTQALKAPQNVAAVAGTGAATVSWDPAGYDYGTPVTGYTVTANNGASVSVASTARSAQVVVPSGVASTFTVTPVLGTTNGVTSVVSNTVTATAPSVYPVGASALHPSSGTSVMNIPVVLSSASAQTVTVQYNVASYPPNFAAVPGVDYAATSGTLTFAPGQTQAVIPVTLYGTPTQSSTPKNFLIGLQNATNATIGGYYGLAVGTIAN